ncbi:hypothetical protein DIPPA_32091, partial [Diplonema papillatum]
METDRREEGEEEPTGEPAPAPASGDNEEEAGLPINPPSQEVGGAPPLPPEEAPADAGQPQTGTPETVESDSNSSAGSPSGWSSNARGRTVQRKKGATPPAADAAAGTAADPSASADAAADAAAAAADTDGETLNAAADTAAAAANNAATADTAAAAGTDADTFNAAADTAADAADTAADTATAADTDSDTSAAAAAAPADASAAAAPAAAADTAAAPKARRPLALRPPPADASPARDDDQKLLVLSQYFSPARRRHRTVASGGGDASVAGGDWAFLRHVGKVLEQPRDGLSPLANEAGEILGYGYKTYREGLTPVVRWHCRYLKDVVLVCDDETRRELRAQSKHRIEYRPSHGVLLYICGMSVDVPPAAHLAAKGGLGFSARNLLTPAKDAVAGVSPLKPAKHAAGVSRFHACFSRRGGPAGGERRAAAVPPAPADAAAVLGRWVALSRGGVAPRSLVGFIQSAGRGKGAPFAKVVEAGRVGKMARTLGGALTHVLFDLASPEQAPHKVPQALDSMGWRHVRYGVSPGHWKRFFEFLSNLLLEHHEPAPQSPTEESAADSAPPKVPQALDSMGWRHVRYGQYTRERAMTDPGLRELAAQVQAQGQQMATLMAAVNGLVEQARSGGARMRDARSIWLDEEDEEEAERGINPDGTDGEVEGSEMQGKRSKAEDTGGRGGKGKTNAGENDDTSGGGNGVAKQEASGGKQGKKKKKRNGGWIEVSGRKPTAARAMEEKKVQEGEKAVERARKAKIELRQEDWGVPVVDHTELAEATVAFAPMASARRIRREGMPEGSAVVTVAALEGSRRTDVVCRVDGAEKVLPGYVT